MDEQSSKEPKKKYRLLKIFAFIVVIIVCAIYMVNLYTNYLTKHEIKTRIISANQLLTDQDITIGEVEANIFNKGKVNIARLTIYNPQDYISSYAININELDINVDFVTSNDTKNFSIPSIIVKKAIINYDINQNNKVNLYQIIDNITKEVAPNSAFNPLSIFSNVPGGSAKINYKGAEFYIGQLNIIQPVVNVYKNRTLVKTIELPDVEIKFENLNQPTNYGYMLLATSLHLIDALDSAVKQ